MSDTHFFVNGREYRLPSPLRLASYGYIVALATAGKGRGLYTVTFDDGAKGGTLAPDQSVKVTNGMQFDCVRTGSA